MAWFLVRNQDKNMPPVSEWRETLNNRLIPEAQAFMAENPHSEAEFEAWPRYRKYEQAKRTFEQPTSLSPDIEQELQQRVNDYEAKPESEETLKLSKALANRNEHPQRISKLDFFRYHKQILEVDALKTDQEKQAELDAKSLRALGKRGDIIDTFPHDKIMNVPQPHVFWDLLHVEGITEAAKSYTVPDFNNSDPSELLHKRRYYLAYDELPVNLRNKLEKDRYLEIEWSELKLYIRDKQRER